MNKHSIILLLLLAILGLLIYQIFVKKCETCENYVAPTSFHNKQALADTGLSALTNYYQTRR
jgi:hypothetical protein